MTGDRPMCVTSTTAPTRGTGGTNNAAKYMSDLMDGYRNLRDRFIGDIDATEPAIREALGGIADVVSEWTVQGGSHYAKLVGRNGREVVVSEVRGHYTARLYERNGA